jgi:hypothetical protein
MSCDITAGRIEQCKDSVSGLKAMYLINYDDLNSDSPTYVTYGTGDNSDEITAWLPVDQTAGSPLQIYKFELKSTANSFTTAINSSRDNGTTFFEQTLVAQLKRQDVVTHKNVKLLAYGRPRIIVRSMTDQFFLVGLDQGADVSAGSISSGAALGDFNGYELTFTAMEELPANFLLASSEADLLTLFNNGTDDAQIVV